MTPGRSSDDGTGEAGRRLLLVRHGRTSWNAGGRFQGQTDIALDDVGRAQAAVLGPLVAELRPSAIWASDLRRASGTAAPAAAAAGLDVVLDPRLREIDVGLWAGLTGDEVRKRFPVEHAAWRAGEDVRRNGGESNHDVALRAGAALREALESVEPGGLLVVVSHGGTIRSAAAELTGLPDEHRVVLGPVGNTRWALLVQVASGRWRVSEWNAGPGTP